MTDDTLRAALDKIERLSLYDPDYQITTMTGVKREQRTMADAAESMQSRVVAILRAALAASATDEGPRTGLRYRNDWGEMVADPQGQWSHVRDHGAQSWVLDPPLPAARPAVPALDVERLGAAMARVFPISFRGEFASEPPASRALLMDYAARIAREYAALQEQDR